MFTQHSAGTFEEIHPDGSKVVKIVGDNYKIIAGKSQIHIQGDVNITTLGTVRELIKGDYHLEVEGNYTQKIHKNHRVKVGAGTSGGNREEEINGNHSFQIMNNVKGRVKEDMDIVIDKNETRIVNGTSTLNIVDDYAITSLKSIDLIASDHLSTTTISGIMSYKSGGKLNMKSANDMIIKAETVGTLTFSGTGSEVTAKNSGGTNIALTTHVHSQSDTGENATAQGNTLAPVE